MNVLAPQEIAGRFVSPEAINVHVVKSEWGMLISPRNHSLDRVDSSYFDVGSPDHFNSFVQEASLSDIGDIDQNWNRHRSYSQPNHIQTNQIRVVQFESSSYRQVKSIGVSFL
jgi:hypothetical protein